MCSIIGVGERLHWVLGHIWSNCGCHGNQKLPLTYIGENGVSLFSVIFDRIFVKLAGIQDSQKSQMSLNSGRIGQFASELHALEHWNGVSTFSQSFLIRSSSNLQIFRTGIKSHTSSNPGQIGPFTSVFTHPWVENDVSMLPSSLLIRSLSNLQVTRTDIRSQTCFRILARSDQSLWSYLPLIVEKGYSWHCSGHSPFIFYWIFMKLADNLRRHKMSHFKIWTDWTVYLELPALDCWKRLYFTFWACWTQVKDCCPLGNLFSTCIKQNQYKNSSLYLVRLPWYNEKCINCEKCINVHFSQFIHFSSVLLTKNV